MSNLKRKPENDSLMKARVAFEINKEVRDILGSDEKEKDKIDQISDLLKIDRNTISFLMDEIASLKVAKELRLTPYYDSSSPDKIILAKGPLNHISASKFIANRSNYGNVIDKLSGSIRKKIEECGKNLTHEIGEEGKTLDIEFGKHNPEGVDISSPHIIEMWSHIAYMKMVQEAKSNISISYLNYSRNSKEVWFIVRFVTW